MRLPGVGLRMIKTVIAVFLCFMIDYYRGTGVPFYSAIAAILCMQKDVKDGWKTGLNRIIGTFIGGISGIVMLFILHNFSVYDMPILQYFIISLSIIPVMYVTVLVEKKPATYITCVVYLSITVSHGLDIMPYAFALNRILDTLMGIFVSLGINAIPFLKNRKQEMD